MEDDLWLCIGKEALRILGHREVVVAPPGDERVMACALQPLDETAAEEASSTRDDDVHRVGSGALPTGSQSTRPIQRSRFAAYQEIVRETPSSHETRGFQPVSRFSLS